MAARFHVRQAFAIEKRHVFVLVGTALEGTVTAGMSAAVPLHGSLSITIPIDAVELVRRGGAESGALTSSYSRLEELETLPGLDLAASTLEIAGDQRTRRSPRSARFPQSPRSLRRP